MLLLDRVLLEGKLLPLASHLEIDRHSNDWESDTGTPQMAIYDKQNRRNIKLFPIPGRQSGLSYTFSNPGYFEDIDYVLDSYGIITDVPAGDSLVGTEGVTTDVEYIDYIFNPENASCDPYSFLQADISSDYGIVATWTTELKDTGMHDPQYGVVVGIEGLSINSDFGVLTSLSSDDVEFENMINVYGVTTDIIETFGKLTIYYLKRPDDITSLDSVIEIDEIFDAAIKYYVTGKALRDDMDAQNRTVGNEELQFYDRELIEAIKDDVMDFTRNNTQYTANYIGAFQ
jgi:hypothetical protein